MSAEDLEAYENKLELDLYREYRDVVDIFTYAVETERRFYLCNAVDLKVRTEGGGRLLRGLDGGRLGLGHVSPGEVR